MTVWTEGSCPCGALVLIAQDEDRVLCMECLSREREAARRLVAASVAAAAALAADPLRCDECETRMLAPAVRGLCGICDEEWVVEVGGSVFRRACWAMDGEAA